MSTNFAILSHDSRLHFPSFKKTAALVTPPPAMAPAPGLVTRLSTGVKSVGQSAANYAVNRAKAAPGKLKDIAAGTKAELGAIGNAGQKVVQHIQDKPVIRSEAAQAAGVHPLLANMSGRHGAMIGAGLGAALGAINPGRDSDGEERSALSGMISGGMRGGLAGGAAGAVVRRGFVDPKINPHMPAATEAVKARRAPAPAAEAAAAAPAALPPPAEAPAPVPAAAGVPGAAQPSLATPSNLIHSVDPRFRSAPAENLALQEEVRSRPRAWKGGSAFGKCLGLKLSFSATPAMTGAPVTPAPGNLPGGSPIPNAATPVSPTPIAG